MPELDVDAHIGGLDVGASVSVMTAKDVEKAIEAAHRRNERTKTPYRQAATKTLDASGNGEWSVGGTIPSGKRVEIARIVFWADGYTPVAPYTNASLWVGIYRNRNQLASELWDYHPYGGASQLPLTAEYSSSNILHFQQNEYIVPVINGGPANGHVTCIVSGYIYDIC